ncbi:MAG: hypothetical protein U1E10_10300, partial [Bdellovibrionales bacterium]|nr:hypothetical protein [Bdellovibrionales bacterium]
VWAESVYRNDMCMSFASGTEQRETCEANAKAFFISNTPTYNERLTRIVNWIRLNHQLGDFPDTVGAKPQFRFSNGAARFGSLCARMSLAYSTASNGSNPQNGCVQKIDGSEFTANDLNYQTRMLEGLLPNNDSISASSFDDELFLTRYRQFEKVEVDHFDHFHIETSK